MDPSKLWTNIGDAFGEDYFMNVITELYKDRFSSDPEAVAREMKKLEERNKVELNSLRSTWSDEIYSLKKSLEQKSNETDFISKHWASQLEKTITETAQAAQEKQNNVLNHIKSEYEAQLKSLQSQLD
jgi:hypothetical protein